MSEMLRDYLALVGAVKGVFNERVKCWQKWQDNQRDLNKKREAKTRFELAGRTDKLPAAKAEVIEVRLKISVFIFKGFGSETANVVDVDAKYFNLCVRSH